MYKLQAITTLLILLIVASCSSDVTDQRPDPSESTFVVNKVVVETTGASGMNNIEVLKTGKVLNFSACIKEQALNRSMIHRTFTISGGSGIIRATTDESGCLYWSEAITIEDYESMGFQQMERTIEGQKPYYGKVTIPFAFQPLEDGGNAVIDLRYSGLPSSEQAKALRNNRPRFMLGKIQIIPAISVQTQEQLMTPYRVVAVQIKVKLLEEQTGRGITKHKFKVVLSDTPDVKNWDDIPVLDYAVNTSGDFVTSANIEYKRYAGERYMRKYIVVKSMERPFDDTPLYREVYINPWQWWEKFFFWDSKWDEKGEVPEHVTSPIETPQLLIQEVWLSYTGNVEDSYRLDKHLNFVFTKNYQIKFRPFLNRKKTYVPRDELLYEKVQIAELKARLTLIRPKNGEVDLVELENRGMEGLEDYEYVTGTEVIVPVRRALATANFDLTFNFTDIPFMVTRSLLLIEIAPSDSDWDVDSALVTITMKAGEFWVTEGALFATEINPDGYIPEQLLEKINQGKKISSDEKHEMPEEFLPRLKWNDDLIDPLTSYVEYHTRENPRMRILDEADAEEHPYFENIRTDRELFTSVYNYASGAFTSESYVRMNQIYADDERLEQAYKRFLDGACNLFFPPAFTLEQYQGDYPQYYVENWNDQNRISCRISTEPMDFFQITPITFIMEEPLFRSEGEDGQIINHVVKHSTGRDRFGVKLNLKKGRGSGESIGASNSVRLSLASLLDVVPPLGAAARKLGLDAGYSYSNSRVTSDSSVTDMGVSSSYALISDHLQLGFKARSRSCLLIEKRADLIIKDDVDHSLRTYMICSEDENSMQYFREDWYFVNPSNTDLSHFVDYNGIQNRNMIYPMRGIHNFVAFRDLIASNLDTFLHTNQEIEQPLVRLALRDLFNISPRGIPAFSDSHFPGLIIGNYLER